MRVFPAAGITAPRFPFEKLYSFFICPSFLRCRFPNRDNASIVVSRRPNHNHQGAENVCSLCYKALLSLGGFIFDGGRQRIAQDAIPFGKGHAVLLEIGGVFLRIIGCGHQMIVCMGCISCKGSWSWFTDARVRRIEFFSHIQGLSIEAKADCDVTAPGDTLGAKVRVGYA